MSMQQGYVNMDVTRKSKRMRTISSRLDGRYQCDKRIKSIISHQSSANHRPPHMVDAGEHFSSKIQSLKRLAGYLSGYTYKSIHVQLCCRPITLPSYYGILNCHTLLYIDSPINMGDSVSLSLKEIRDIVDRQKPMGNKVWEPNGKCDFQNCVTEFVYITLVNKISRSIGNGCASIVYQTRSQG